MVTTRGMEPWMRVPNGCFERVIVFHLCPVDEDALFLSAYSNNTWDLVRVTYSCILYAFRLSFS